MSVQITWLGHASFRIASGDAVVYVDPWKLHDEPHDADVVFVSHSHHDHCSPPDVAGVSKQDTTVLAPVDTARQLGTAQPVEPGQTVAIKAVTIEVVGAYNVDKSFHPRANNWCGAVVALEGKRIYYAGDTDFITEMGELRDIDLALLPVGGTYTLDADQAVEACRAIGPTAALPYHWGDIVGSIEDARRFAAAAPCKVHLLEPLEAVSL